MKKNDKKAQEFSEKLEGIFELYGERTEHICSNPELIDNVNRRKRHVDSMVHPNGIKKPICKDGILNCGRIEFEDGYWTRYPNGCECMDYINSSVRLLVITKDSNEGVEEYEDTTNLGVEWDIRSETLRSNNSEDICIVANFAQTYMRIICLLILYGTHTETEILDFLQDIDKCRQMWEEAHIARINLKKQPGKASIRACLLASYISLYEDVLNAQIDLLNPTVIINSARKPGLEFLKRRFENKGLDLKCMDGEYGEGNEKWIYTDKTNKVIVIDVYHFSCYYRWNRTDQYYYRELLRRLEYALTSPTRI